MSDDQLPLSLGSSETTQRANRISKRASKAGRADRSALAAKVVEQLTLLLGDGYDATIRTKHDRAWVEIDEATVGQLNAVEGDRVIVGLHSGETRVNVIAIMGGPPKSRRVRTWRVWLCDLPEVDSVDAVTLKRARAA